jgi:hypothetical protein
LFLQIAQNDIDRSATQRAIGPGDDVEAISTAGLLLKEPKSRQGLGRWTA